MKLKIFLIFFGWTLLGVFALSIGPEAFALSFRDVHVWQLTVGLLLILAAVTVRAQKWHVLFGQWMSRSSSTQLYFAVLSFAAFSPLRAADLAATPVLKRKMGIEPKISISALFVEKVIDFCILLLFAMPALLLFTSFSLTVLAFLIACLLALFLLWRTFLQKKAREKLRLLREFTDFFSATRICHMTILSLCALLIELYAGYLLVDAFFEITLHDYMLLKPVSIIIGLLSFVPAGIGVESYSLAQLFGLVGVASSVLAASIVVVRMLSMAVIVITGQCALLLTIKKKH